MLVSETQEVSHPVPTHYSVFVSHSMNPDDLPIVYAACNEAKVRGVSCYVAERDWQFWEVAAREDRQGDPLLRLPRADRSALPVGGH